ncbi:MAG: hypothetical protein A2Y95_12145 [Deltaproteobacteria bacterium RBG_13_65_10]|jgi:hypothetical protein|nr:MAG: hypothetical protein A2Y95_12145 [Deltaproteobacteria bacterium RBG_13_65_10]
MPKSLLRCQECNRLLLLGPHNQAPAYRLRAGEPEPLEIRRDDEADFRAAHAKHCLDELRVVEGSVVSEGWWADPMRVSYFEATDGRETVVVRRHRTKLDRPVNYEVIPGAIEVRAVSVDVQSRDLARQLEAELGSDLAPPLVMRFVDAVQEFAGSLEPEDLEEICTDPRDPLVSYARLDEKHVIAILDLLRPDVPAETLRRLNRFVVENSEGDDVMNLMIRKAFTIRESQSA